MAEKPTYEELEQRIKALEQEKLERTMTKEVITRGDKWPTHNIESKMNPDIHIPDIDLDAIINAEEIQSIMDEFWYLTHMTTAILDLKGRVIEATGWQDICTKFHRIHPKTAHNCTESDLFLAKDLKPGEYAGYKCKNGLWDVVTPLYIGTQHLGNIYIGQFFYDDEQIDEEFFIKQAAACGFDKDSYMDALRRVPKYNRETVNHLMRFLVKFSTYISRISFVNIQLEKEIRERRQAEDALKESETHLRTLLRTIPDLVWLKDHQGIYLFCNSRFESLFGAKEKDIMGKTDYDFVDKELADFFRKHDKMAMAKGNPSRNEEEVTFAEDGHREILETIKTPMYRSDGQLAGVLGIGRDITGRKRAEAARRESESFIKSVMDNLPIGIAVNSVDPVVKFEYMNDNFSRYYRTTREALADPDAFWTSVYEDPNFREEIKKKILNDCASGDPERMYWADVPITRKGEETSFITARNITVPEKQLMISTVWDVTDRKHAEEEILELNRNLELRVHQRTLQLEEASKELEDFVYSVSHDLRAPLRSISGFAEIIDRRHKNSLNEEGRHYFDNIVKASRQMGNLIDDLLKFSRLGRKAIKIGNVSLDDVFEAVIETLSDPIKKTAAQVNIPEKMPVIRGDITLATHIFINLLGNAVKYHKPNELPCVDVGFEVEDPYLVLSVADNGIGIEPEYHEKIFNMFQRLHSQTDYPGTGIGLAAVKKAVQIMDGRVWVESKPGEGSVFKIKVLMAMTAQTGKAGTKLNIDD